MDGHVGAAWRGLRCVVVLFSAFATALSLPPPAPRQTPPEAQGTGSSQLPDYAGVQTVVDWPLDELRHRMPELKGIEPSASVEESSEKLPLILKKVGESTVLLRKLRECHLH